LKGRDRLDASLGGSACSGMAADAAVARAQTPRQADQRLRPAPPWRRPGRRRTARSRSGPSPTPPCSTRPTCAWRACQPPWPGCSIPRSAPLGRSPWCAPRGCTTRSPQRILPTRPQHQHQHPSQGRARATGQLHRRRARRGRQLAGPAPGLAVRHGQRQRVCDDSRPLQCAPPRPGPHSRGPLL